ncbi:unnamed protein product [Penicillium salamii]|uniref:Uncharacterized protein n=1 Tax=Penicillium salamii TaxID=1612424 RepID=A0A9W4JW34_9EURO|nr:unnamed protein product [Penicillium salamii]
MEETIAELRRQLAKKKQVREEAERQVQPNTLLTLLDRCHTSLSQSIRVETNATLRTQGDATDPVNRLYPKRIVPWLDFPQIQEQVWRKFDHTSAFTSRPLFPSDAQIDYRDSVDNFVELIIQALYDDTRLRHVIQGRVTIYDRANPSETSLENTLEEWNIQDAQTPQQAVSTKHRRGRGLGRGLVERQESARAARRRDWRADQFCVHSVTNERQKPVYAVEFKAPHRVTIPELVAGLRQIDLARDVIDQEGDSFEFDATRLVAAVVTQIFSYMIDCGVRYGYICSGEAFVFLRIPKDDPTLVQYFLCIPN